MSTHRHIDRICCIIFILVLLLTLCFVNGEKFGITPVMAEAGYASGLFDTSRVHTIDIVMEDWEEFLDTCENEEYFACLVVIDNEVYKNVGIRAKGNTSLSSVAAYGNDRYSFKIEFDCYEDGKTYHGLDKISLNNIIQDNTYMKDYLAYQMMGDFGVAAPLCSYAYITVNGKEWGLYLAVEGVEESFLARNYGRDYGNLYKPDSMDMGGGRGNGGRFHIDEMKDFLEEPPQVPDGEEFQEDFFREAPDGEEFQEDFSREAPDGEGFRKDFPGGHPGGPDMQNAPDRNDRGNMPMQRSGQNDVALVYSDDQYDSYKNIFDNCKTKLTDADKNRLIASLRQLGEKENIEDVVDVDAVIRYFVVHNFVCNFDSYTGTMMHNYYLYEKDGKLSMIPWDYNLAFGGFEAGEDAQAIINFPIDSPVLGDTVETRPMLAWIFASEEYTQMYHQYFQEFINTYFTSGYFEEMIDSVREMIAPYVEKSPVSFCTYEEFETGADALKQFCLLRAQSIEGQLAGTIPSTSAGQEKDGKALVDAQGLSLSDMGSMGRTVTLDGSGSPNETMNWIKKESVLQ